MPYYIGSPIFPIWVELRTDPSSKCHDYNTLRTLPASSASEFFSFFFPAVPVSEFFSLDSRPFKLLDRASYPLCADLPEISSVHARRTKRQVEMPEMRRQTRCFSREVERVYGHVGLSRYSQVWQMLTTLRGKLVKIGANVTRYSK